MERRPGRHEEESGDQSWEALETMADRAGEKIVVEEAFKDTVVPPWRQQLTVRTLVTGLLLSLVFNFIVCKLNLSTGVIPSLNVAAGLLGFAMVKSWTSLLEGCGLLKQPFTRQETTVIQTCVVASSGIAFSSGTATYLLGMSAHIAAQAEGGNTPANMKKLSLGWIIGFLFVVSFVGLFSIVPLRKVVHSSCLSEIHGFVLPTKQMMILRYKVTYHSGTANL